MDGWSLLTLALLAIALAAQPWSVLAGIVLVTAKGGVAKEVAYVAGWIAALAVVAIVTIAVFPSVPKTSSTSKGVAVVELLCGAVLGVWLLLRWRRRTTSAAPTQPKWMTRLDTMSPIFAFVLGCFLPNYVFVVAAVGQMLQAGLHQASLALVAVAFILVASLGVAAPLFVLAAKGSDAPAVYHRWRSSLVEHSQAVVYAVGALVAVVLVAKGVVGLVKG